MKPKPSSSEVRRLPLKVAAMAATASPAAVAEFEPSPTHRTIAGALALSPTDTVVELAAQTGLDRGTISAALSDPTACAWIAAHCTTYAKSCLGFVHAHLLDLALKSRSSSAIRLYLERFDPDYRPAGAHQQAQPINAELAQIIQMTPGELDRWISQRQRRMFGEGDGAAAESTS